MNPERIPRLDPTIASDPRLCEIDFTTPVARIQNAAEQRRLEEQCRIAREKARQRAYQQLQQMESAADHVRAVADRAIDRIHQVADRKRRFADELVEWQARLSADEVAVESVPERFRKALLPRKPHVDEDEDRIMHALDGKRSQVEIAREVGCAQSTVSRHLNGVSQSRDGSARGRPRKLSDEMLNAAARFMFLLPGATLTLAAAFLQLSYHVVVSRKTLGKHLRRRAGFRLGDFKTFHVQRNAPETIDIRFRYVARLESEDYRRKFGPNPLYDAIYYDEMPLARIANRKIWSVRGWIPSLVEESVRGRHVSLLLAVSPAIGVVWYEVLDKTIDGDAFLAFCNNLVKSYVNTSRNGRPRLFILDNARFHHARSVEAFFGRDEVARHLVLEFLPPYSPFLDPCEELFALIKIRIWLNWIAGSSNERSLARSKQTLVEEVRRVTTDDIRQTYDHMREFLSYCKDRRPVFTQKLYECAHHGDEERMCPTGSLEVDDLLNSYLPQFYEEFTPSRCQHLRDVFGCSRLTKDIVEQFYDAHVRSAGGGGAHGSVR